MGSTIKMSTHFCQFSAPLPLPFQFLLKKPLPQSVWALSWKTVNELQKLWKNKKSLKKTCMLCLFLASLSTFQSSTQEDGDKMTSKYPLLSSRNHTEKSVHIQLSLLPSRLLLSTLLLNPSLPQGADIFYE